MLLKKFLFHFLHVIMHLSRECSVHSIYKLDFGIQNDNRVEYVHSLAREVVNVHVEIHRHVVFSTRLIWQAEPQGWNVPIVVWHFPTLCLAHLHPHYVRFSQFYWLFWANILMHICSMLQVCIIAIWSQGLILNSGRS